MKIFRIAMILVLLFCLTPAISVISSSLIADAYDCPLHEGFANPCVINGADWGETLAGMFVAGWFMLMTLPVLVFALVVWISVEIIAVLRARLNK